MLIHFLINALSKHCPKFNACAIRHEYIIGGFPSVIVSDVDFLYFPGCCTEQTVDLPVIWEALRRMWRYCYAMILSPMRVSFFRPQTQHSAFCNESLTAFQTFLFPELDIMWIGESFPLSKLS